MRWYKHYTDNHRGRTVQTLLDELGHKGVVIYYFIVEMCAEKVDVTAGSELKEEDCSCSFRWSVVERACRAQRSTVSRVLRHCDEIGFFELTEDTGEFHLKFPMLLNLLSSDQKRPRVKRGRPAGGPRLEKNRIEKKRVEKNILGGKTTKRTTLEPEQNIDVTEVRTAFLKSYEQEFGHTYPGWGAKENSQAKAWLRSVPIAKAIDLCLIYPKWNDPWVTKQGHPFGILVTQFVQLEAWAKASEKRIAKIASGKAMETVQIKRAVERQESENGLRERFRQIIEDQKNIGENKKPIPIGTVG